MKITTISRIAWRNSRVEVIDDIDVNSTYFWLNEKHIETRTGHLNLPVIANKYDPEYKYCRFELVVDEPKYQPCRKLIRNDFSEKMIKSLKMDKIDDFRRSLELSELDVFNVKQQIIIKTIKEVFEVEDI